MCLCVCKYVYPHTLHTVHSSHARYATIRTLFLSFLPFSFCLFLPLPYLSTLRRILSCLSLVFSQFSSFLSFCLHMPLRLCCRLSWAYIPSLKRSLFPCTNCISLISFLDSLFLSFSRVPSHISEQVLTSCTSLLVPCDSVSSYSAFVHLSIFNYSLSGRVLI